MQAAYLPAKDVTHLIVSEKHGRAQSLYGWIDRLIDGYRYGYRYINTYIFNADAYLAASVGTGQPSSAVQQLTCHGASCDSNG